MLKNQAKNYKNVESDTTHLSAASSYRAMTPSAATATRHSHYTLQEGMPQIVGKKHGSSRVTCRTKMCRRDDNISKPGTR